MVRGFGREACSSQSLLQIMPSYPLGEETTVSGMVLQRLRDDTEQALDELDKVEFLLIAAARGIVESGEGMQGGEERREAFESSKRLWRAESVSSCYPADIPLETYPWPPECRSAPVLAGTAIGAARGCLDWIWRSRASRGGA